MNLNNFTDTMKKNYQILVDNDYDIEKMVIDHINSDIEYLKSEADLEQSDDIQNDIDIESSLSSDDYKKITENILNDTELSDILLNSDLQNEDLDLNDDFSDLLQSHLTDYCTLKSKEQESDLNL